MEKRIGSSAGLLALIALVLHSLGFSGGEDKTPNPVSKKDPVAETGKKKDAKTKAKSLGSNDEWQGPWRATQQYFHSDIMKLPEAEYCQAYLLGLPAMPGGCSPEAMRSMFGFETSFNISKLQYLIATVHDPLHTRMALETDRDLDAIQRGASLYNWEFATQWLPWTPRDPLPDSPNTIDLEHYYPGLLVFRRHFSANVDTSELLVVLVVAETPTAGINGFQFDFARRLICKTGSAHPEQVRIAGPTFSGSFHSLTWLLGEWGGTHNFVLHAGSVSNSKSAGKMIAEFRSLEESRWLKTHKPKSTIAFHGDTLPTVPFEEHFKRLVERLGFTIDQAAAINEGGTGFSAVVPLKNREKDTSSPVPLYSYSRDLAQVRNNYNDAAFVSSAVKKNSALAPALEFSLKDAQQGEDGFPMFSTNHTPVSKNAELQEMIRYLKQRGVRIASLSATNVFDTLFLANVLRRYCPDIRIVLRGPDLLFGQEASQISLSGLLAISPFLPPELGQWSRQSRAAVNVFASDNQYGQFLAVSTLLGKDETISPQISPAWLMELGGSGWFAIDRLADIRPVLDERTGEHWFDQRLVQKAVEPKDLPPIGRPPLRWSVLCLTIAAFTFCFCGRLYYLKLRPHVIVWSLLCLSDFDIRVKAEAINRIVHFRYLCLITCYATLAFLNAVLLVPMIGADSVNLYLKAFVYLAFVAAAFTAVYLGVIVTARVFEGQYLETSKDMPRLATICLRAVLGIIPFAGIVAWWLCAHKSFAGYLLCFRSLNLSVPLSPIVPLLLSGCGVFALAYFQLRRFTWSDRRKPHLDTAVLDKQLCNEFSYLQSSMSKNLCCPRSLSKNHPSLPLSLVVSTALIVFLLVFVSTFSLRSFEPSAFLWIFIGLQVPLAVFSFIAFLRFLRLWSLLKAFIVSLNSVALGRYVERLPEFAGNGPVWMREVKLRSFASSVNSAIALHNLDQTKCLNPKYATAFFESLQEFLEAAQSKDGTRRALVDQYEVFRKNAGEISKKLGEQVLTPYWASHELPYVASIKRVSVAKASTAPLFSAAQPRLSMSTAAGASGAADPLSAALVRASEPREITTKAYEYASKYVALQYSIFIGYMLQHLQNLLLCSTLCFVFIVAALNSFEFQFPQALSYSLAIVLVISACIVVVVLAQLERDPILSRLSGTQEGKLGRDFYLRALAYGALPVLTVVSSQFPAISRFISSWVEPAVSKLQ